MQWSDIAEWRSMMGWSRAKLARALGIDPHTLAIYEAMPERCPRWMAMALAAIAYGLPPYQPGLQLYRPQ